MMQTDRQGDGCGEADGLTDRWAGGQRDGFWCGSTHGRGAASVPCCTARCHTHSALHDSPRGITLWLLWARDGGRARVDEHRGLESWGVSLQTCRWWTVASLEPQLGVFVAGRPHGTVASGMVAQRCRRSSSWGRWGTGHLWGPDTYISPGSTGGRRGKSRVGQERDTVVVISAGCHLPCLLNTTGLR